MIGLCLTAFYHNSFDWKIQSDIVISMINFGKRRPAMAIFPRQTRSRLEKHVVDTRLESTSPSANVFLTFCRRHIAMSGLVTGLGAYYKRQFMVLPAESHL